MVKGGIFFSIFFKKNILILGKKEGDFSNNLLALYLDIIMAEINDLSIDDHNIYAVSKSLEDKDLLSSSSSVASQVRTQEGRSTFIEQATIIVQSDKKSSWAAIETPKGYFSQKNRLFSYILIPSIGSDEKLEILMQKIQDLPNAPSEEITTLMNLLKDIQKFISDLTYIKSKMNEFKQG